VCGKKLNYFAHFLGHESFHIMYQLSYLDIKHEEFRGGNCPPPSSVCWFSCNPAGIGLKHVEFSKLYVNPKVVFLNKLYLKIINKSSKTKDTLLSQIRKVYTA